MDAGQDTRGPGCRHTLSSGREARHHQSVPMLKTQNVLFQNARLRDEPKNVLAASGYQRIFQVEVPRPQVGHSEQKNPLRMAEVFAQARKIVLYDGSSMLVGRIVTEERRVVLAVLEDGRCVATSGDDRDWYVVSPSLTAVKGDALAEIERF